jgi:phosphohistidine swiveling domain-containing protein
MTTDRVLDGDWDPDAHWSRTNLSEAMPGVLTPLSWTVWQPVFERSMRRAFSAIGALERSQRRLPPDPREAMYGIFYGRVAAKVEFLGAMGDRLPGTSGAAIAEQFFGSLPAGFRSKSTLRRLPAVALRFPAAMATSPRRVRAVHADTAAWWSQLQGRVAGLESAEARHAWTDALDRFDKAFDSHTVVTPACVQPIFDQVQRMAGAAGHPELAGRLVAGQGSHVEVQMIDDLWAVSRGHKSLDEFLAVHGYHGPREGEISARVWREEPRSLVTLVEQYRATPDTESPSEVARQRILEAQRARQTVLASLPRGRRDAGALILAAASRYTGLRGVGKAAFVQALDGARMIARRIGTHLADVGALSDPEDVFFLTAAEVAQAPPGESLAGLVQQRRAEHRRCEELSLPTSWRGRPEPIVITGPGDLDATEVQTLSGVGASPGVVEGPVRVVTDPDCDDVQPGEILVAPVTDPAWAAIMFISAGLVVDIGGQLSHAAVVARELGIPCVMGIPDATKRLRTGDVCRIDGHAGTVEILRRATPVGASEPRK